jgi:hypothetical protein
MDFMHLSDGKSNDQKEQLRLKDRMHHCHTLTEYC